MPPSGRGSASSKEHKCSECDKTFSRKEYVVRHARLTHQGARPYGCTTCDATFARSDLLKRHERTCNAKKESEGESLDSPLVPPQNITAGGPSFPTLDHAQLYSYPIASTSTYISPNLPSLSPPSVMDSGSSTESPQTPFGLSPPNEPPMLAPTAPLNAFAASNGAGKEQTLAPVFTRSFSQDEILASEVLEDLLRSPPQYGQTPSFMDPNASGMETIGSGSDRPWHGAMATTGASNEAMSVVGSQGWDLFDGGEQGIENSPAARGLADYFNKGGVGGISALDLGFSKDICMFPDHIFDTKIVHHDDDMRFFLPTQKFCLGYLFPWNVPELDTLSAYGKRAAENFLPSVPLIHPGTLMLSEMPTHTAFALTVAGAAYSAEGEGFSNEMLVEKRVYLVRGFNKEGTTDEDRFATLQSMLLYQLLGLFHREEQQRLLSHTFHGALVSMLRQLELPRRIKQTQLVMPHALMQGDELDAAWKTWIEVETRRRVCFIVYLTDLETASTFNASPFLPTSELCLDLPSSDAVWNASTAEEWRNLITSPWNPAPISFLEAVRVLLSPTEPSPLESGGILLAELARLSSFPLLILSRTLSFLQSKTEEAIRQVDPFRSLLSGIGIIEGREQENREVLARIMRGREILKRLPGGVKRGGGEKWFEGVMPQAAAAAKASSSSPPNHNSTSYATPPPTSYQTNWSFEPPPPAAAEASRSAEEENRQRESAEKAEAMRRHRERKAKEMESGFPEFMAGMGMGI